MTIDFSAAALAYLRFVLTATQQSPTALAKQAGVSSTTLTRPLNKPEHKFTITTKTIEKIAAASGISPAPFFQAKDLAELSLGAHPVKTIDQDRYDLTGWDQDSIQVIGSIEVGVWREIGLEPSYSLFERPALPFKSLDYAAGYCFASQVRDTSVNNIAQPGDYLICEKAGEDYQLYADDLVVVEVRRNKDQLFELSARRLRNKDDTWLLETESSDPRFEKLTPLYLGQEEADARVADGRTVEQIRIIGVVDWVLRGIQRHD